jgi:hypothetical protein
MLSDFKPPGLRGGLRWLNRRRSLVALVQAAREVLPGDSVRPAAKRRSRHASVRWAAPQ